METLIKHLVEPIVADAKAVSIDSEEGDAVVRYELTVADDDHDTIVGERGRTLRSIKTILSAAAGSTKVSLDLVDPDEEEEDDADDSEE